MEHELIYTITASILAAFIFGVIARKLKLPAIFGYLLAGVFLGPFSPGFVANMDLAIQLAEIGIILLMFGVGIHFSFEDLIKVKKIATTGALIQMVSATLIAALFMSFLGYNLIQGIIFGFAISIASTIVLIRSLERRNMLHSDAGKIAVGWLIVEDIIIVISIVLLPVIAGIINSNQKIDIGFVALNIVIITLKIVLFFVFMIIFGKKLLPMLLSTIVKMRSAELSTLGTLAIALGFAFIAYAVFDASFSLGAFLAGMVLSKSEIGKKFAENSLPMRDAFSVIFFVSVGMLFDPRILINEPFLVFITFFIIVFCKGLVAFLISKWFKQTTKNSFIIAISLAQIGEFSFILSGIALSKGLIDGNMANLILSGAMLSIVTNPFLFSIYSKYYQKNHNHNPTNHHPVQGTLPF